MTTNGGSTEFAALIRICESCGPYCLIGDFALNCYVEPVYTLDADIVVYAPQLTELATRLEQRELNSDLRIQFTKDGRYQDFLARSVEQVVLGTRARVACLEDVTTRQTVGLSGSPAPPQQTQER